MCEAESPSPHVLGRTRRGTTYETGLRDGQRACARPRPSSAAHANPTGRSRRCAAASARPSPLPRPARARRASPNAAGLPAMVSAVAHAVTGRRHHVAALNAGYALARMVSAGSRSALTRARACSERAASVHMRGQRRAPRARDTSTAVHTRSREMPREPSRHRWRRGQGPQRRSRPGRPWQTMADHVRAATHNARQCAPMQRSSSGDTYRADLPL